MAMTSKDADFFRPMWRRVLVTGVVVAWCAYETFFSRDTLWITITVVALVYCVWNFFLRFPKDEPGIPPGSTGGGTSTVALSGSPDSSPPAPSSSDEPKA